MSQPPSNEALRAVKALVFDCDGVLTDGELWYDEQGRRALHFHAHDGAGLAMVGKRTELKSAVLSGRAADIAEARHAELGLDAFVGKCRDKAKGLGALCEDWGIATSDVLYVGDDIPDLPAFRVCGLAVAVANARPEVVAAATWVTDHAGGRGAVREVCEAVLKAQGYWDQFLHH